MKSDKVGDQMMFTINHIRGVSPAYLCVEIKSEDDKLLRKIEMKDYFAAYEIALDKKNFKVL